MSIIFFDGYCTLCIKMVSLLIKYDRSKNFHFVSIQSEIGQSILAENKLLHTSINSFLLLENGKFYTKSTAVLRITKKLPLYIKWLYILILIPEKIRNYLYEFISNNRYKWFAKNETCMKPPPEISDRFL